MNNHIQIELKRRLDAAKSLETHIANLQWTKTKLQSISESGHAVDISIKTSTMQTSLHASTSGLDVLTPSEVQGILVKIHQVVTTKLDTLKKEYAAL